MRTKRQERVDPFAATRMHVRDAKYVCCRIPGRGIAEEDRPATRSGLRSGRRRDVARADTHGGMQRGRNARRAEEGGRRLSGFGSSREGLEGEGAQTRGAHDGVGGGNGGFVSRCVVQVMGMVRHTTLRWGTRMRGGRGRSTPRARLAGRVLATRLLFGVRRVRGLRVGTGWTRVGYAAIHAGIRGTGPHGRALRLRFRFGCLVGFDVLPFGEGQGAVRTRICAFRHIFVICPPETGVTPRGTIGPGLGKSVGRSSWALGRRLDCRRIWGHGTGWRG